MLFRRLHNDKTFGRKYEPAILLQNFLREPPSQPKRAEPCDQENARRQNDLFRSLRLEKPGRQECKERYNDCDRSAAERRKPRI
jgi:hypothetical protein